MVFVAFDNFNNTFNNFNKFNIMLIESFCKLSFASYNFNFWNECYIVVL